MMTCVVDICERPARAANMCVMHYKRWQRGWPDSAMSLPAGASLNSWRNSETGDRCLISGCDRPPKTKNLCGSHYSRHTRGGHSLNSWAMHRPLVAETYICEVPNCSRPHTARGFCRMHYERWKTGRATKKSMLRPSKREYENQLNHEKACEIPGCEQPVLHFTFCKLHYGRVKRGMSKDDPRMLLKSYQGRKAR